MKKLYLLGFCLMILTSCAVAQDIKLPQPNKNVKMSLMDALQKRASSRSFSDRPLSLQTLSQLLWAACGVNRPEENRITAPSAINAQDIKVYVVKEDGAYLYLPQDNALRKVSDKDLRSAVAGRQEFATKAPVSLVMVSDQTKFGNRSEGAKLMGSIDSGYVSENICLACVALGLVTVPRMSMDKDILAKELGLADTDVLLLNNPVGYPVK